MINTFSRTPKSDRRRLRVDFADTDAGTIASDAACRLPADKIIGFPDQKCAGRRCRRRI